MHDFNSDTSILVAGESWLDEAAFDAVGILGGICAAPVFFAGKDDDAAHQARSSSCALVAIAGWRDDVVELTETLATRGLAVVVFGGATDAARRVALFAAGADDVISGPFDASELRGRVRAALRRAQQPPALARVA